MQSGSLVFATRDEVRAVRIKLEVRYDIAVRTLVVVDFLPGFGVEECDFAGFVPGEDMRGAEGEDADVGFDPTGLNIDVGSAGSDTR